MEFFAFFQRWATSRTQVLHVWIGARFFMFFTLDRTTYQCSAIFRGGPDDLYCVRFPIERNSATRRELEPEMHRSLTLQVA